MRIGLPPGRFQRSIGGKHPSPLRREIFRQDKARLNGVSGILRGASNAVSAGNTPHRSGERFSAKTGQGSTAYRVYSEALPTQYWRKIPLTAPARDFPPRQGKARRRIGYTPRRFQRSISGKYPSPLRREIFRQDKAKRRRRIGYTPRRFQRSIGGKDPPDFLWRLYIKIIGSLYA